MPVVRGGAQKWKARTAAAQGDYASGVANPRRSWAQATQEAEGAYQSGVQDAISRGAFGRGVQNAGDQKYQAGVKAKGVSRFASGVTASGDAYERGFAPYRQVIEATNLPPRGRRGDPQNLERVRVMAAALNAAKQQQSGR